MARLSAFLLILVFMLSNTASGETTKETKTMLPKPSYEGKVSIEETIRARRTIRSFKSDSLTISQLSQLLWAAQGVTDEESGFRSAPSGGALYPLDVYVVVGRNGVAGLEESVLRYLPKRHAIEETAAGDQRSKVAGASFGQDWIAQAPAILVITAEYQRITKKYGKRGVRYALIEVGHVGQNIFLQAEALGLGAGIVGAFDDDRVAETIGASPKHEPLLVMPVGYYKK